MRIKIDFMKRDFFQRGNSSGEAIVILVVIFVIIIILPKVTSNGSSTSTSTTSNNIFSPTNTVTNTNNSSSYTKNISLNNGNAAYAYQPYEEYITINNYATEAVNITGWQLRNAKDKRPYDSGGNLQHFAADTAIIPQGALFISPTGTSALENIVLKSGDMAYVVSGQIGSQLPYKITSFKENICSGFLEDLPEYEFNPPLSRNCPRPASEPGITLLDVDCRKFIERMSPCHTPKYDTLDKDGEICRNCVDNEPLSNACIGFIKNHFNYNSCIANHRNDADFSGQTWRIFLGKGWEMWAKEYETISLFDQFGKLVTERIY